jgi:TetR/AcrR family transcriptional repressor of nem operon
MRYDAEHKQKTRQRVLKEAAKAIREDGPERVAVAAVMAKAGLTHGGFYAHFKSKDELIVAAIGEMFEDARGRFARSTEGYSPVDGLVRYIDFYLSANHRDSRASGCPITALAADLPRLEGAVREQYGQGVAGLTERLAGQLDRLGQGDPAALAHSVVAELVGALSLARATSDAEQSNRILAASRAALKQRLGLGPSTTEHQS